ncbi:MAG: hypothetical protein LKE52_00695 [Bacilli bacterium]|jgi:DNA-directed RNA polymerase specialized sigma24 family protein|nr:hypothetical protein [Bacilli bacterium]
MKFKNQVRSIVLSGFQKDSLDQIARRLRSEEDIEFPATNYDFSDVSFQELGMLAKTEDMAMEEFLRRQMPLLLRMARIYKTKNPWEDYDEVVHVLLEGSREAIQQFDPDKGQLSHFLSCYFKSSLCYLRKNHIRDMDLDRKYYGNKVDFTPEVENLSFADSLPVASPGKEMEAMDFLSTCTKRDREIYLMHARGIRFRDIAKRFHAPLSSVSYRAYAVERQYRRYSHSS